MVTTASTGVGRAMLVGIVQIIPRALNKAGLLNVLWDNWGNGYFHPKLWSRLLIIITPSVMIYRRVGWYGRAAVIVATIRRCIIVATFSLGFMRGIRYLRWNITTVVVDWLVWPFIGIMSIAIVTVIIVRLITRPIIIILKFSSLSVDGLASFLATLMATSRIKIHSIIVISVFYPSCMVSIVVFDIMIPSTKIGLVFLR